MQELAGYIADGAMAFLKAEWKVLGYFAVIAAILLGWSGTLVEDSSPVIALSFLFGAVLSAFAGYVGMRIATKANVRTTQAARTSLAMALGSLSRRGHRGSLRTVVGWTAAPLMPAFAGFVPPSPAGSFGAGGKS